MAKAKTDEERKQNLDEIKGLKEELKKAKEAYENRFVFRSMKANVGACGQTLHALKTELYRLRESVTELGGGGGGGGGGDGGLGHRKSLYPGNNTRIAGFPFF